ncbi:uncharacterized protein PODANS_1_5615 [Podospora anserina S mat+]|uniref:Podospora anserina S mat+ genomic DNA chromosome 1, supercontig 1 n=1 Tax=Podospora anserina (strain S / ATCC MYA-4624 / DSM 980 / FGSC 10383) TaxID=515849 RepID=B2AAY9_PODAN|nr:uncharacterized protein PODANS_1_5615 [Podospora anserina S mat+]CAP60251.1 unnamed protein product [Podospora anserina S mat+]CDP22891.1 Putative protein of unknown function [Podospora anserina S mat+]
MKRSCENAEHVGVHFHHHFNYSQELASSSAT